MIPTVTFWLLHALLAAALGASRAPHEWGVLLLGHGGSAPWNRAVLDIQKALQPRFPIEVAFGMADPREIQTGIDRLSRHKVKKVVVVPLFISSHSEVIEETKFVLGIREHPSREFLEAPHAHMNTVTVKRIQTDKPLVMTSALDDHPLVAKILTDRARQLSRDSAKEHVVLVGHGPLKDEDNELWMRTLATLGETVRRDGSFAGVYGATLRDDASPEVRRKADEELRALVRSLSHKGRVLVVPHLIAQGGIERHIRRSLEGTFYAWSGETLLPDARIAEWVELKAREAAGLPDMRRYKGPSGSLPPAPRKRAPAHHTGAHKT